MLWFLFVKLFFFFKQKTAYEMRISDWSSDVCSSDLRVVLRREPDNPHDRRAIEVLDARGAKLGYVARIDNSAVARMMDAGERFEARIARLNRATLDIRLEIDWLPA